MTQLPGNAYVAGADTWYSPNTSGEGATTSSTVTFAALGRQRSANSPSLTSAAELTIRWDEWRDVFTSLLPSNLSGSVLFDADPHLEGLASAWGAPSWRTLAEDRAFRLQVSSPPGWSQLLAAQLMKKAHGVGGSAAVVRWTVEPSTTSGWNFLEPRRDEPQILIVEEYRVRSGTQGEQGTTKAAPAEPVELLNRIVEAAANEEPEDALDLIYGQVDELLRRGALGQVDSLLGMLDPSALPVVHLLAFVSITYAAREHLPGWSRFVGRVRAHLASTEPARVEELLAGFE